MQRNYNIPLTSKLKYQHRHFHKEAADAPTDAGEYPAAYPVIKITLRPAPLPVTKPAPPLLPHQQYAVTQPGTLTPALKTLVIGLGGLGGKAATYLHQQSCYRLATCAVDTNARDLVHTQATFRILLGKKELRGLGTGIAPNISAKLATNELAQLEGFVKLHGYEQMTLVAGLGGGTGTGALPLILDYAKRLQLPCTVAVTMPFDFEGRLKNQIASSTLATLTKSYPKMFVVHQQTFLREYPAARFTDALTEALFAIKGHIEAACRHQLLSREIKA